ncbi:ankyrin [Glonium stellatum]|uniref:Ankyrin n=1 Tax=Glonium stellatum TaxID=574774 RepID=A0A8E2EYA9_9PEZI|nr:ankyrin [Glonium stellatum]
MDKRIEEIAKIEKETFEVATRIGRSVDAIQQDQLRDTILRWISSADFPAQQSDFINRRQKGTGQWFFNAPIFNNWIHGSNQTLFFAYVYCNYKTRTDQTTTILLAAILRQLVQGQRSIPDPILRLHEYHSSRGTRPSLEEIFSAIQFVLKNCSSAYLVVDALDECTDEDGTPNLHLMVTSRFILEIENEFREVARLDVRASNEDVEQFILGKMNELPKCIRRDDELQRLVQDRITKAADGMFLLARLHLDLLRDMTSKKQAKSTLGKISRRFPGDKELVQLYDQAYDDAIKRIESQPPNKSELGLDVLSWIIYAHRPLTTGELRHALAVELGEEDFDEDNIREVEDIISVCAGLVTVEDERHIIHLVHYTTQEYFKRTEKYGAHFETRLKQNLFLDYASQYWGHHAWLAKEQVFDVASIFLQDRSLISCAVQATSVRMYSAENTGYSKNFSEQVTGLHLLAIFGLLYLLERFLLHLTGKIAIPADLKDSSGRTPLSWAVEGGHEAVVKFLVERDDVDANSRDQKDYTPLMMAAGRGHKTIVKLSADRHDVKADLKNKYGRTPLWLAATAGHEAAAKLLAERDDAAAKGSEAIVKLLVERNDVEADPKDDHDRTPLARAAQEGHEAIVKPLVERDDVKADTKDRFGLTPLSWAAGRVYKAVVELLIERGDVEADSKDTEGRTPLSWATERGYEAVVGLLAERDDVEVNLKDNYGRTPLSWVVEKGCEVVVKLLQSKLTA